MDWYLSADDRRAVTDLRREIAAHLSRHAEPGTDVGDAELVVEEVVGNAVRHAGGPVWVTLSWQEVSPTLVVRDLGPGFDPTALPGPTPLTGLDAADADAGADDLDAALLAEGGRGLLLVTHLAPALEARSRAGGGMVVSVVLPVQRPPATSFDPPRRSVSALPALDEARPEGGFGKEPFLRALVVQLAAAVELAHGPDAADAAVAQVGTDVGGQMEQEFRAASGIVGSMTPEQVAECYVRLKHAIDGQFFVVEVTPERIVLGNRRCPFGEAVRAAPSLCRMTSSVFGGVAARNHPGGAAVLLEERIAVGDHGCRVVVYLGSPPAEAGPLTHRYGVPT